MEQIVSIPKITLECGPDEIINALKAVRSWHVQHIAALDTVISDDIEEDDSVSHVTDDITACANIIGVIDAVIPTICHMTKTIQDRTESLIKLHQDLRRASETTSKKVSPQSKTIHHVKPSLPSECVKIEDSVTLFEERNKCNECRHHWNNGADADNYCAQFDATIDRVRQLILDCTYNKPVETKSCVACSHFDEGYCAIKKKMLQSNLADEEDCSNYYDLGWQELESNLTDIKIETKVEPLNK